MLHILEWERGAPILVANKDPSMAPMPDVTYKVPKARPLHADPDFAEHL